MVEIIPTINAPDWETVKQRFLAIAPYSDWVEIDVSDGKFTKTITWNNPADLKTLQMEKYAKIAVHLMVYDPEMMIHEWIRAGARRVIVQYEGIRGGFLGRERQKKIRQMADLCENEWVEFGLSITDKTFMGAITRYVPLVKVVQVLAVVPGPAGQRAQPEAFVRVRQLSAMKGGFKIEWDGGAGVSNIRDIANAGADIITAATAIFGSEEPEKALEALKRELLG